MAKRLKKSETISEESVSLIPIMNLVCLLIPFLLYTASFIVYATVDVTASNRSAPCQNCEETPQLSLMVVITDEGFRVANSGEGTLPSSCGAPSETGSTLFIPLAENGESCTDNRGYPSGAERRERQALRLGPPSCAYDFNRLQECMLDIKSDHPDQSQIVISGEANIDYDVLIHAMDATRGSEDAPLFPNVSLAAGVA